MATETIVISRSNDVSVYLEFTLVILFIAMAIFLVVVAYKLARNF